MVIVPVKALSVMEHPFEVCRVMALFALSLTPSMMSISPSLGQFGPNIQNAGLFRYQPELSLRRGQRYEKDIPCAANSARHVRDIEGKQAIVINRVTCDTHAVSAAATGNIGAVDTHVDVAVLRVNIAIFGSSGLIDIVHIASSRVG